MRSTTEIWVVNVISMEFLHFAGQPAVAWRNDSCFLTFKLGETVACESIRFSSLFAAGDVSRETSPATKSEEKRMFSQARETAEAKKLMTH